MYMYIITPFLLLTISFLFSFSLSLSSPFLSLSLSLSLPGSSSNKHSTTSPGQSLEQDDNEAAKESGEAGDGGEGGDEVLVEVAEEGATTKGNFVDEFRQEQRLEKSKTRRPSKGTFSSERESKRGEQRERVRGGGGGGGGERKNRTERAI